MSKAYGRKKRREHRAEIARLEDQVAVVAAAGKLARQRADELERWLAVAVRASVLLVHPRHLGKVPEGALAAGNITVEVTEDRNEVRYEGPLSVMAGDPARRSTTVRIALDVLMLAMRFGGDDQAELALVTERGIPLPVRLAEARSARRAKDAQPVVSLHFEGRPGTGAYEILHAIGRREVVYLVEMAPETPQVARPARRRR